MGKSYIIKYEVELDRDKDRRTTCFEMRIQDIVMRYATHRHGAKKGDQIRVWEQVGYGNYIIDINKDIEVSDQDTKGILHTTSIESKNKGIKWANQWYVPRGYYSKREATHAEVSF